MMELFELKEITNIKNYVKNHHFAEPKHYY